MTGSRQLGSTFAHKWQGVRNRDRDPAISHERHGLEIASSRQAGGFGRKRREILRNLSTDGLEVMRERHFVESRDAAADGDLFYPFREPRYVSPVTIAASRLAAM